MLGKREPQTRVRLSGSPSMSANYAYAQVGRNHNTVRHQPKIALGPISYSIAMLSLALVAGLIYITQGPRATGYDYTLQEVRAEVARYESIRDDLALENARLSSVVASETSEMTTAMVDAGQGRAVRD